MKDHALLDQLTQQVLNKEITLEVACFRYMTRDRTGFNHGPAYILGVDGIEGSRPVIVYPFPERAKVSDQEFGELVNKYANIINEANWTPDAPEAIVVATFEVIKP